MSLATTRRYSITFALVVHVCQEVNGGVLNVAHGGRARFKSSMYVHDVEVRSVTDENSDFSSDLWHGGCIYNSVRH